MTRKLTVLLTLLVMLGGCKAKEIADKAAISKDLERRGTTDLMEQVADDKYTPPADGRLTDAQVQMYLRVREHEKKIAQVAREELKGHAKKAEEHGEKSLGAMMEGFKAIGSAADLVTADIRAAKDLGLNTQEYLWVKQQILAASTAELAQKYGEAISTNVDKAYEQAKKAYEEAKDEQTKKIYADLLASYDKSRQEMQQQQQTTDPAAAFNKQLLSKYESALNAIAHEWSKYEDKEGDAEKGMKDLEQKLDEAKKQ